MDNKTGIIEVSQTELAIEIQEYLRLLFPIARSITGAGNVETLKILQEIVPLQIKEYKSGTSVYDWKVPDEWTIKNAWIKDSHGNKIVDYQASNLHVVNYSTPVHKLISFEKLKKNLHYDQGLPNAIPYRTTYYEKEWGFCVTERQYQMLYKAEGPLEIKIDSEHDPEGNLTFGELIIPGESAQEILISTYFCHPSLANDNLSGTIMTAFLARELLRKPKLKRGYRIVWVPETIGAIAYCAMNESDLRKILTGLVVTTVGGPGPFGYKQSYNAGHSVNVVIEQVFRQEKVDFKTYPFDIHGSDERQYSSPGFGINTASITKDKYYEYPFYHTSLDNLDFIKAEYIESSLNIHLMVLEQLNTEPVYENRYPNCEVMLSKHDLYPKFGGAQLPQQTQLSELDIILWLLWLNDGKLGLFEILNRLGITRNIAEPIIEKLESKKILQKII